MAAAKRKKLERGAIRTTTFSLMNKMKLTPSSSAELKDKVITAAQKALKIDPGTARSVVNFGLRERDVYKTVIAANRKAGRSAARKGIKTKTTRKHAAPETSSAE